MTMDGVEAATNTTDVVPNLLGEKDLPKLPAGWLWKRFDSVCERVSVGHVGPTTEFFCTNGSGIPLIRSQDVRPGRLMLENAAHITPEFHARLRKSQLKAGDVLFVRVGANRGDTCVVPQKVSSLNCANIVFARPYQPNGFFGFFFRSPFGRNLLLSATTGAAQGVINTHSVAAMPVPVPPLSVQERVAGILSAYDDLMENNQRRIKILEEMARTLYREWFVNFRYPGHEKVPLVDSPLGKIPKGWEVSEFRYLFNIKYGKTLPISEIREEGLYPVYGAGDVIGYYDKILCAEKCALVTSRGNGSGTVWRTREAAFVTNNSLIILPQERFDFWSYAFVELLLKHSNVMEAKTGSAQPKITIDNLNYVKAIVPSRTVVESFCMVVTPMYEQGDLLIKSNENLTRARRVLLPKLVSGDLRVEGTGISSAKAVASASAI